MESLPPIVTDVEQIPLKVRLLTEGEREAVFNDISRQAEKARIRRRWYPALVLFSLLSIPLAYPIFLFCLRTGKTDGLVLLWFSCFYSLLAPVFVSTWYQQDYKQSAVGKLAALQDVRAVGLLADVLAFPDAFSRSVAGKGLAALLPHLKSSDAMLLNTLQRENLRRALTGKDVPLILAILRVYQQIGDEQELEVVEKLLGAGNGRFRLPSVQQAARDCLPFLQAKAHQNRISLSLLRGSAPPSELPAEMLRSVSEREALDPQQLLRSVGKGLR